MCLFYSRLRARKWWKTLKNRGFERHVVQSANIPTVKGVLSVIKIRNLGGKDFLFPFLLHLHFWGSFTVKAYFHSVSFPHYVFSSAPTYICTLYGNIQTLLTFELETPYPIAWSIFFTKRWIRKLIERHFLLMGNIYVCIVTYVHMWISILRTFSICGWPSWW